MVSNVSTQEKKIVPGRVWVDPMEQLGERARRRREDLNLTRQFMADRIGIFNSGI